MKKIKFLSLALLATMCALFLVSCDDNDTTIEENAIPDGTSKINFSVQVYPSSLNSGKVAGLSGVKVTINQNGSTQSKTTNESGIVAFDNLNQGYISIFVDGPEGFLSINGETDLECYDCLYDQNDSEQVEYDQLVVELPRVGATLRGKLFADVDFLNGQGVNETVPAGTTIIARTSTEYEPNVFKTTVAADGTFSFNNLPEEVNINLDIDFKKVDTTPTPTIERSFYFDGIGTLYLSIDNPTTLGNVYLDYN
jgi:hypothetical protein